MRRGAMEGFGKRVGEGLRAGLRAIAPRLRLKDLDRMASREQWVEIVAALRDANPKARPQCEERELRDFAARHFERATPEAIEALIGAGVSAFDPFCSRPRGFVSIRETLFETLARREAWGAVARVCQREWPDSEKRLMLLMDRDRSALGVLSHYLLHQDRQPLVLFSPAREEDVKSRDEMAAEALDCVLASMRELTVKGARAGAFGEVADEKNGTSLRLTAAERCVSRGRESALSARLLEALLDLGADANQLSEWDSQSRSLLMIAASSALPKSAELLLAAGAKTGPGAGSLGRSAAHWICAEAGRGGVLAWDDFEKTMVALALAGEDFSAPDAQGRSPRELFGSALSPARSKSGVEESLLERFDAAMARLERLCLERSMESSVSLGETKRRNSRRV